MSNSFSDFMSLKAWRYGAIQGLQSAAAVGITVLVVTFLPIPWSSESNRWNWLSNSIKFIVPVVILVFVTVTVSARWDLWRNNQVKPK